VSLLLTSLLSELHTLRNDTSAKSDKILLELLELRSEHVSMQEQLEQCKECSLCYTITIECKSTNTSEDKPEGDSTIAVTGEKASNFESINGETNDAPNAENPGSKPGGSKSPSAPKSNGNYEKHKVSLATLYSSSSSEYSSGESDSDEYKFQRYARKLLRKRKAKPTQKNKMQQGIPVLRQLK
jgi:hypothetical protein